MFSNHVEQVSDTQRNSLNVISIFDNSTKRRLRSMRKRKVGKEKVVLYNDNCLTSKMRSLQCSKRTRQATKIGIFYWSMNRSGLSQVVSARYLRTQTDEYDVFHFMEERSHSEEPILNMPDSMGTIDIELKGLQNFLAHSAGERLAGQYVFFLEAAENNRIKKVTQSGNYRSVPVALAPELLSLVENAWADGQWGSAGWKSLVAKDRIEDLPFLEHKKRPLSARSSVSVTIITPKDTQKPPSADKNKTKKREVAKVKLVKTVQRKAKPTTPKTRAKEKASAKR